MTQKLVLTNNFGEETTNVVGESGTTFIGPPIPASTVVANLTLATADPVAAPIQTVANALPAKAGVTAITAQAAVTIALSTSNVYNDATVNAAVNAALATIVAKVNAILAAVKVVS